MTRIRATCPRCTDEVDLRPHEVTLHIVDPVLTPGEHHGSYGFDCPSCDNFVVRPAGEHAISLLIEGGVEICTDALPPWEQRTAPPHPESPPGGPPLTHDDLLDLHLALQRPDWFAELEELVA